MKNVKFYVKAIYGILWRCAAVGACCVLGVIYGRDVIHPEEWLS